MQSNQAAKIAKRRSDAGLSRIEKTFRTNNNQHPKKGGSHGYPLWLRIEVMDHVYAHGMNSATVHYNISKKTIRRWLRRLAPYHQTGNHDKESIVGIDQILLCICLFLYPRAKDDKVAAFIFANGGALYSQQRISERCNELRLTRKRASLEAANAYTERNIIRTEQFWTKGPRIGVAGVPRYKLIDVDEASFCLKKIEKKYGRAYTCCRVRDTANYTRMGGSINLLMAVEPGDPNVPPNVLGSTTNPRRWYKIVVGTVDQFVYASFIDEICTDIEQNPLPSDNERYFLWDNLALHGTAYVSYKMEMRPARNNFRFVPIPRPPYQPKFAPIEYIFCQIACELGKLATEHDTIYDLRQNVQDICATVGINGALDRTFYHCGYIE